jgi:uncharacterized protein YfiM (DUF2279 family)
MMRELVLVLALHAPGDRWIAPDKVKHFFLAAFVQSVSYSALRTTGVHRDGALVGASAVTLAAAVGKEVYDYRSRGDFSVRDLTWGVAGGAAASLLLARTR